MWTWHIVWRANVFEAQEFVENLTAKSELARDCFLSRQSFRSPTCVTDDHPLIQSFVSRYPNYGPLSEKWIQTLRRLLLMPPLLQQRVELLQREEMRAAHAPSCNLILLRLSSHDCFHSSIASLRGRVRASCAQGLVISCTRTNTFQLCCDDFYAAFVFSSLSWL